MAPNRSEAYEFGNEYFFGSELLAAPVVTPRLPGLNVARVDLWLPEGLWYDIFEKRAYRGGRTLSVYRALDKIPVFAHAGAILPMTDDISAADVQGNPAQLHLYVFLGASGSFTLYEDDNESNRYQTETGALTEMVLEENETTSFSIHAVRGCSSLVPKDKMLCNRIFRLCGLHGHDPGDGGRKKNSLHMSRTMRKQEFSAWKRSMSQRRKIFASPLGTKRGAAGQ